MTADQGARPNGGEVKESRREVIWMVITIGGPVVGSLVVVGVPAVILLHTFRALTTPTASLALAYSILGTGLVVLACWVGLMTFLMPLARPTPRFFEWWFDMAERLTTLLVGPSTDHRAPEPHDGLELRPGTDIPAQVAHRGRDVDRFLELWWGGGVAAWNAWCQERDAIERDFRPRLEYLRLPMGSGSLFLPGSSNTRLALIRLRRGFLASAQLNGADLRRAQLEGAQAQDAQLQGVDLSGANLDGADLLRANLQGARLCEARLRGARLIGANLDGANLGKADLRGAILAGANLRAASLRHAHLEGADLEGAALADADVTDVFYDRRGLYPPTEVDKAQGSPSFRRFARDQDYLEEFRRRHRLTYFLWLIMSDCGRSFSLWAFWSLFFAIFFAWRFWSLGEGAFALAYLPRSPSTMLYYSVVIFTMLGFGDIVPNTMEAAWWVMAEVITGYVMLGGLISIFATKLARRS